MQTGPTATSPNVERLIEAVEELHSSPAAACRVVRLLRDPDFDIVQVEKILESDPALAAAVLRLVNSACFGLANRIASLRQAIAYLGARTLRLTVLSFGLVGRLARGAPARVCRDFWRRSLTMASAASLVCRRGGSRAVRPDEAYSAGLLADVGVLVLAQVETARYVPLYEQHSHGIELTAAEHERFDIGHPALGQHLLGRWNLPEAVTRAAATHHAPPSACDDLSRFVVAGDMLADALWTPQTPRMSEIQEFLQTHFQIDLDALIALAMDCKQEIQQYAEVFRVHLEGSIDCDAIRRAAHRQFKFEAIQTAMDLDSMTAVTEQDCPELR